MVPCNLNNLSDALFKLPYVLVSILSVISIILSISVPIVAPQTTSNGQTVRGRLRYNASSIDCLNVTEIMFTGIFPCLRDNSFEASQNISECDLLAEAAAHLAVERVNEDQNVLPNVTLSLHPIYSSTNEVQYL